MFVVFTAMSPVPRIVPGTEYTHSVSICKYGGDRVGIPGWMAANKPRACLGRQPEGRGCSRELRATR